MSDEERLFEESGQPTGADAPEGAPAPDALEEDEYDVLLSELLESEGIAEGEPLLEEDPKLLRAERDEYLDALRRLQAEFDNYRKRVTRQQSELVGRAAESLIERFLPVLDALDLALAHSESPEVSTTVLADALQQISALARDTLAKEGLESIAAAGAEFDPTVHDAVAHLPRAEGDTDSGVVVDEVLRPGYQLKGRVLRPAMVRVRG